MAKAQFHRNQKVWVSTVGTWAVVEKIVPIWAKGFDEPVKIIYDVGLGRDFLSHELTPEEDGGAAAESDGAKWRILRARNKWQAPEDCSHHPYPGSFPVVVTDKADWGGWRTPGAEYDRDPRKIEAQARLIMNAPKLLALAQNLIDLARDSGNEAPPAVRELAEQAMAIQRFVDEAPAAGPMPVSVAAE